jgi:hypothetical protein
LSVRLSVRMVQSVSGPRLPVLTFALDTAIEVRFVGRCWMTGAGVSSLFLIPTSCVAITPI